MDAQTDDWGGIPISDASAPKADDWGGIPIEEAAKPAREQMQSPITRGTLAVGSKAIDAFKEGFGDAPWGSWIKPEDAENYPKTASAWKLAGFPVEVAARTFSGGVNALRHGAAETYTQLGGDPDEGRRFGRDIAGMAESRMFDAGQNLPKPHPAPKGVNVPAEPAWEPSAGLKEWMGPSPGASPMTPREGTSARLLPHDYPGTGIAGDPHFDAAWESLGSRGSMGAAGRPGGPLADIHPEAIQTMRDIIREEGLSPWELERRQEEERSPHHFGGEWSDAMRNELRGLNSLGGEGANIIGQSVRARRRDAPERLRGYFQDFAGERIDPRAEVARREQANKEARPFWQEFDRTPIPPTEELAGLNDALRASGAWSGAEKALRMERVPRENQFVELPNTGEYVLANPSLPSETVRVPTAKFYQAAKEHLDGLIEKAMGAPGEANNVRILVGLKKALTEAIDKHPDPTVAGLWKQSREVSSGQKQWEASIALGKRVLTENVDGGDFSMLWDTLSDQQKVGVRKGALESLSNRLGRVGNADVNTMRQVLGDNNQQKLRIMQEREGAAERLISNIEHEHGMSQGPLTGPNTADKLAAQARYKPKESWMQTVKPGDLPHGFWHGVAMGGKKAWEAKQAKMVAEAQKQQNLINADIARLMTLQGPEWNAVVRYLHGVEPTEPSPGTGPRPSPRPAPARPSGDVEPPPPSQVPEGPPGYPQPEMTAVEATQVLRDFGYPQATINSMGGQTRMQTADMLRRNYPKGPPAKMPDFPGEVTPRAAGPAPIAPESPLHPKGENQLSLLEWIRKQGGISPDDPLAGDVRAMFGGKNPGGIIRKGGKRLDRLREGAVGEKYFLDKGDIDGGEATTDVNTLLDAMVREADGEKQYPLGSEVGEVRNKDMEARNHEQRRDLEFSPEARRLDRELSQYGVTRDMVPGEVRQRAVELLRSGVETDAVEAFERAVREGEQATAQADRGALSINRASGGRVDASAINPNPTEAQKEAGNYAKDHVHIHGLDITIENAKGSKRSGVDKGGKAWSVALPAHYGYIKGSVGADKDHVDCYIGPHIKASKVYVIDQKDAQTGKFDEHKCFIGFASAKHARNCYLKAFSDGKGADRLGAMHEADIDGFKTWLANGDTTKALAIPMRQDRDLPLRPE